MPSLPLRPLADITTLRWFLKDNLLSREELQQLTETERANLNHDLVHRYVKLGIISITRAKSLSKDEFLKLTDYNKYNLFIYRMLPLEELLSLSTRRAVVLSAPNVTLMISRCLLTPQEAIELNDTFDFLYENYSLRTDVLSNLISPRFALMVHNFYIQLSTMYLLNAFCEDYNRRYAEFYKIELFLEPKTSTHCCTIVGLMNAIMREIRKQRERIFFDAPLDIKSYLGSRDEFRLHHYPRSLLIDTRQKSLGQSNGYREYCLKIIKDSFHFLRSPSENDTPVKSTESEQNRDMRLKLIGHRLNSMWSNHANRASTRLIEEQQDSTQSSVVPQ